MSTQSEAALEAGLIATLRQMDYEYVQIVEEDNLYTNFKRQLEIHNRKRLEEPVLLPCKGRGGNRCGDCPADVPYTSCRSVPSVPWGSSRQSGMPRKLHSLAGDAVSGVPPSGRSVWIAVLPAAVP